MHRVAGAGPGAATLQANAQTTLNPTWIKCGGFVICERGIELTCRRVDNTMFRSGGGMTAVQPNQFRSLTECS